MQGPENIAYVRACLLQIGTYLIISKFINIHSLNKHFWKHLLCIRCWVVSKTNAVLFLTTYRLIWKPSIGNQINTIKL